MRIQNRSVFGGKSESVFTNNNQLDMIKIHKEQQDAPATVENPWRVYVDTEIDSSVILYAGLINLLEAAQEGEVVNIYLASVGGDCHVGTAIVNSMKSTRATVVTYVLAPCYSMASVIALASDYLVMSKNTFLMFHNWSGGNSGKAGEAKSAILNTDRWLRSLDGAICSPFLTDDELDAIQNDQDIYIHSDDKTLEKRLCRHFPAYKKQRRNKK